MEPAATTGEGTEPSVDPATSEAKARVEAALDRAVAGGRLPGTDQLRSALMDTGLPAGAIEVTQGRTPTGLEADAVEAAVHAGGNCVVAQVRQGSVTVSVMPGLAQGGCLVGATG